MAKELKLDELEKVSGGQKQLDTDSLIVKGAKLIDIYDTANNLEKDIYIELNPLTFGQTIQYRYIGKLISSWEGNRFRTIKMDVKYTDRPGITTGIQDVELLASCGYTDIWLVERYL